VRFAVATLLVFFVGISHAGCAERKEPSARFVVRVATSAGLSAPTREVTGTTTAHLLNLLFLPARTQVTVQKSGDGWMSLKLRAATANSSNLAQALRHPRLKSAQATGPTILAEFNGPVPPMDELWLETGDFEVVEFATDDKLVLRRRQPQVSKPDQLVVLDFPSEEELWRRFLGGQVDVIPVASNIHARQLRSVPSVRLVKVQESPSISLYLNVTASRLSDSGFRRALALSLQRAAIAEAATGDASLAWDRSEDLRAARELLSKMPRQASPLRIMVLRAATSMQRAMIVVERQWATLGLTCEFAMVTLDEASPRLQGGDYDAFVFYGSLEFRHAFLFVTSSPPNLSRYSNPELDAAVKRGDKVAAMAILEADLPAIPLYRLEESVAVHRKLCNVHPKVIYDLSWLADLRLCAPGETD